MRLTALLLTLPLIASCAELQGSEQTRTAALCEASQGDRTAHAGALLQDGGPRSKLTGATLLGGLEAGCATTETGK